MADVLLHNTLIDQAAVTKAASSTIDYENALGQSLATYIKAIIDANTTTGSPYYVAGGGAAQFLCDLSDTLKISTCTANYSGSGTNGSPICNTTNPWHNGSVLTAALADKTPAEMRTLILAKDTGAKVLTALYTAVNAEVEKAIYVAYVGLRHSYTFDGGASETIVKNWWNEAPGGAGTEQQGSAISSTNLQKVCNSNWKLGHGPTSCTWTVPSGTVCAKFQVWGAGQGTNGGCCCGGNQFGSTGAYSEAILKVTPGDTYTVCAACSCSRYCCSNSTPGEGCMSGVIGNGICCLSAHGAHCYNGNCVEMNNLRGKVGLGTCARVMNPYCTTSGPCYCAYSEYCYDNSCSTCGMVPVYPGCCYTQYCSCVTDACAITDGQGPKRGHFGIHGGVCLDTNNYGFHIRPPIINSDTGAVWSQSCGCNCQSFTSGGCCGGCAGKDWDTHPGHGGAGTHVMGGQTNHFGDTGRSGMVQISWVTA